VTKPGCPYYGYHAVPEFQRLASQGGNQCGLIVESYSPCRMEVDGQLPDFAQCELNGSGRAIQFATFEVIELVPRRKELPE
jgi:hypothetical protein